MYRDQRLSLVIPCYNEEQGIRQVLARVPPAVDEVIVVDNRSTDDTAAVARGLGARVVTVAAAILFRTAIRDSQSGMWVIRRPLLERLRLTSDGMAFSEEIKLEALKQGARFGEAHIPYGERSGTVKLQKWRDGWLNLTFLVRKRFERRTAS